MRALVLALVVLLSPHATAGENSVTEARGLFAAGRHRQALAILDSIFAREPDHFEARLLRGEVRMETKDWTGSLADLDRAIELDAASAEAWYQRGMWYAIDAKDRRAITQFDRALILDPGNPDAHYARGTARERLGNLRGAREDYIAALNRRPEDADARRELASVEERLGLPPTRVAPRKEARPTEPVAVREAAAASENRATPIRTLFENGNIYAVENQPVAPTSFTLDRTCRVTEIMTYHWNYGRGARPGMVGVVTSGGERIGNWRAEGSPGQGGVPNAYWTIRPAELTLQPGRYTIEDSDPATWAQNEGSRGVGHVQVKGACDTASAPTRAEATVAEGGSTAGSGGRGPSEGGVVVAEGIVGPRGGRVEAPGDVRVDIPAGALSREERVTIRKVAEGVGGANLYSLDRDGGHAMFARPVTLRFTLPESVDGAKAMVVQEVMDGWLTFTPGRFDPATRTLETQAEHFSLEGWVASLSAETWASIKGAGIGATVGAIAVVVLERGAQAAVGSGIGTIPGVAVVLACSAYGWAKAPSSESSSRLEGFEGPFPARGADVHWDPSAVTSSKGLRALFTPEGRFVRFSEKKSAGADEQGLETRFLPEAALRAAQQVQETVLWYAKAKMRARPTLVVRVHSGLGSAAGGGANLGEWDGYTLNIDAGIAAAAKGDLKDPATQSLRSVLAHEYWHAITEHLKSEYSQGPAWAEEAIAMAVESLQVPDWKGFFSGQYAWSAVTPVLRSGLAEPGDDEDPVKRGYSLWPFTKFLYHRQGGGAALEKLAKGGFNNAEMDKLLTEFAYSLVSAQDQLGEREKVTLPYAFYGEAPLESLTGWDKSSGPRRILSGSKTEWQIVSGRNEVPLARPLSLQFRALDLPARDATLPGGPVVIRREKEVVAFGEALWGFSPVTKTADWTPVASRDALLRPLRGVVVPKAQIPAARSFVGVLMVGRANVSESEESSLLAYRLIPPTLLKAALAEDPDEPGARKLRLEWTPPVLGADLAPVAALKGYRLIGRKPGAEIVTLADLRFPSEEETPPGRGERRISIEADATSAFLPADTAVGYPEMALVSLDGAMTEKGAPLTSDPSWLAGVPGKVTVFVGKTFEEMGRPSSPFVTEPDPLPDIDVSWSFSAGGRVVSGSGRTNANGVVTIANVPMDAPVTVTARGETKQVTCTGQRPNTGVTFGWEGLKIRNIKTVPTSPDRLPPPPEILPPSPKPTPTVPPASPPGHE